MPRLKKPAKIIADHRLPCPIACLLDLVGDRWTLLVIRDLFFGFSRYGHFVRAPEGIPTNILADRLERLATAGLVTKKAYQTNPVRYDYLPTPKGKDLKPVLDAMQVWGLRHIPETRTRREESDRRLL